MNVEKGPERMFKKDSPLKKNVGNVLKRTLNKRCIYFKTFTMNVEKDPEITKYAILEMNIETIRMTMKMTLTYL